STPREPQAEFTPFAKRSWTDLGPRVASALVLLVPTIAGLYFGGYVFSAMAAAVFAGCYREWERMVTLKPLTLIGGVLIGLVALSSWPALPASTSAATTFRRWRRPYSPAVSANGSGWSR